MRFPAFAFFFLFLSLILITGSNIASAAIPSIKLNNRSLTVANVNTSEFWGPYYYGNYGVYLYNQTIGSQSSFLNLSGTNANQNINIGTYNLTGNRFFGSYNWTTGDSYLSFNGGVLITTSDLTKWLYNQSDGSYNETYATWLPNYTTFSLQWYNHTSTTASAYGIIWNSTYNVTYHGLINNASYLSTYNVTYDGLINNASYLSTYNVTYDGLINNASYLSTYNASYNGALNNASYLSTFNSTYALYAYNFSQVAGTPWNLSGSDIFAGSTSYQVGIGNIAPATSLHITGSGSGINSGFLRIETTSNAANSGAGIELYGKDGGGNALEIARIGSLLRGGVAGSVTGDLAFSTTTASSVGEKMRLTSDGALEFRNATNSDTMILASSNPTILAGDTTFNVLFISRDSSLNNISIASIGTVAEANYVGANSAPTSMTFSTKGTSGLNNTERMRITSGGYVGIGTTTPTNELHVSSSGATKEVIETTGSQDTTLTFRHPTTNWTIGIDHSNTQALSFSNSNTPGASEYVGIATSGNVGFGTFTPQDKVDFGAGTNGKGITWGSGTTTRYSNICSGFSDAALTLGSGIMCNTTSAGATNLLYATSVQMGRSAIRLDGFTGSTAVEGFIAFLTEPSNTSTFGTVANLQERMRILPNGNVGIGTSTVTSGKKLEVNGDIALTSDDQKVYFGAAQDASITYSGSDLIINPAEVGNGDIGIGTTTPSRKVEIKNDNTANGTLGLRSVTAAIVSGNIIGGIDIYADDNNLPSNPNYTAAIRAVASGTHTAASLPTDLVFSTTAVNTNYSFEALRITQGGNVGIGLAVTPAAKFHVNASSGVAQIVEGGASGVDIAQFSRRIGANVDILVSGGAGDPYINFRDNSVGINWSLGADASDGRKFKLSLANALGTNDYLVVDDDTGAVNVTRLMILAPNSTDVGSAAGTMYYDADLGGHYAYNATGRFRLY